MARRRPNPKTKKLGRGRNGREGEPPEEGEVQGPPPSIALFAAAIAAVPLGIARHAIDLLTHLAAAKVTIRSRRTLREEGSVQADLGRAEALCGPVVPFSRNP